MKVLHITNWYPNDANPNESPFIKRHIQSIEPFVQQKIFHLNISKGRFLLLINLKTFILKLPGLPWLFSELFSCLVLLCYLGYQRVNRNYDIINFHIAYPNLTFWNQIFKWVKIPVVITEHWSAYHLNFGVSKKLPRISQIFHQSIPVIAVSQALIDDIRDYSQKEFPSYIVPNVVDKKVFYRDHGIERESKRFFMVSQWKEPKQPFIVIGAFKKLLREDSDVKLYIGGFGPQWLQMKEAVESVDQIQLLGKLNSEEIALQMNMASAYLHPSDYETFSVVCAEALSCGCPVISSEVGGIVEFVNETNGILVRENKEDQFFTAMHEFLTDPLSFEEIDTFSVRSVGARYYNILQNIINEANE